MNEVHIADPNLAGLTNDHVEIVVDFSPKDNPPSSAYLRRNFERGNGPLPFSTIDEQIAQLNMSIGLIQNYQAYGEKNRGWQNTSVVC